MRPEMSHSASRPKRRDRIAQAGRARCIANGMLNQVVVTRILEALFSEAGPVG